MGVFDTHPGKAVWTLGAVAVNIAKFPLWILYYIPASNRPHRKWSLKQAIQVQIIKVALWHMAFVKMVTPLSLKPQKEKNRWVVIQPAASNLYVGPAVVDSEITPTPIGSTWYPAQPAKAPEGFVVLHFHGGAYMIGDGRTHDAGFAAKTLIANTPASHVFAPQYRLSCNPNSRFPAALQDAIASYLHLIHEKQIPADKIILSGDSAGANLVLSLLRYLETYSKPLNLPLPAAAWLWSPWVSPARSLTSHAFDSSPRTETDYVSAAFAKWGADAFLPSKASGVNLDYEYCSFYDNVFATKVPLYISTGECEVLYDDNVKLAEDFQKIKGTNVKLQVEEHAVHDVILAGKLVGFEKEAAQAAKRAGDWLSTVTSGGASKL